MFSLRILYTLCIGLGFSFMLSGQNFLANLNEIQVDVNINNEILYIHKIEQDETLYSLARFFRIPVQELMILNGIELDHIIAVGSEIKIPLNSDYIIKSASKEETDWIPIIYTVKKQETLYKIAKTYFKQDIESLNRRNNISSFIINENQRLIAGFWPNNRQSTATEEPDIKDSEGAPSTVLTKEMLVENKQAKENELKETKTKRSSKVPIRVVSKISKTDNTTDIQLSDRSKREIPTIGNEKLILVDSNYDNFDNEETESLDSTKVNILDTGEEVNMTHEEKNQDSLVVKHKIIDQQGICVWDKEDTEVTHLLAFHKSAKIGSYLSIEYPLTGRKVRVQVIDNISPDLYEEDIDVLVTKAVAQHLGARDSRFQINMSYYE